MRRNFFLQWKRVKNGFFVFCFGPTPFGKLMRKFFVKCENSRFIFCRCMWVCESASWRLVSVVCLSLPVPGGWAHPTACPPVYAAWLMVIMRTCTAGIYFRVEPPPCQDSYLGWPVISGRGRPGCRMSSADRGGPSSMPTPRRWLFIVRAHIK